MGVMSASELPDAVVRAVRARLDEASGGRSLDGLGLLLGRLHSEAMNEIVRHLTTEIIEVHLTTEIIEVSGPPRIIVSYAGQIIWTRTVPIAPTDTG